MARGFNLEPLSFFSLIASKIPDKALPWRMLGRETAAFAGLIGEACFVGYLAFLALIPSSALDEENNPKQVTINNKSLVHISVKLKDL